MPCPGNQRLLELCTGGGVHPGGQLVDEVAEHLDVFGIDRPGCLRGGRGLPQRRQRFAGQPDAGSEMFGVADPAVGFGGVDVQPDAQHLGPVLRPDLGGRGLGLCGRQNPVIGRLGGTPQLFALGLQFQ